MWRHIKSWWTRRIIPTLPTLQVITRFLWGIFLVVAILIGFKFIFYTSCLTVGSVKACVASTINSSDTLFAHYPNLYTGTSLNREQIRLYLGKAISYLEETIQNSEVPSREELVNLACMYGCAARYDDMIRAIEPSERCDFYER